MSRQYQSFDPNTEITGATAMAFITNILHDDIAAILSRHELDNIEPANWYSVQRLLDVFNDIATGGNASSTFVSVGMAAAQLGLDMMPADLKALSAQVFFANYDAVWQSRHRNGNAGKIDYTLISDDHLMLTIQSPYPDDVFYGAFYVYARHFKPSNRSFNVAYDQHLPTREQGGESTIIHVRFPL